MTDEETIKALKAYVRMEKLDAGMLIHHPIPALHNIGRQMLARIERLEQIIGPIPVEPQPIKV